jgi:spore coat protein CotH
MKNRGSKVFFVLIMLFILSYQSMGQGFPQQWQLLNGHELNIGKEYAKGIYFDSTILRMDITISTPNYLTVLKNNYASKTNIPVSITYNGITYDSVGLRFKGQTSYSAIQNDTNKKKSLSIEMDAYKAGQDLEGYNTLNLNNMYEDRAFMKEYIYCNLAKKHIPASKANYVEVYVNNNNWGLYINVQQLNKDFYKEWYLNNDGSNFRADKPAGTPGGAGWGDGTAALNDKGTDTNTYKQYYVLKSSSLTNPWTELVKVCQQLGGVTSGNYQYLDTLLDIDKALWFLATENIFTDDDGYIYKGKMDYYIYQDQVSKRFALQEFDGNSCFWSQFNTSWTPFQNATNVNYPLITKLMAIPSLRQRYIAHYKELLNTSFDTTQLISYINWNKARIDPYIQVDPKKIYTYAQFNTEIGTLRGLIKARKNYLNSNSEIAGYAKVTLSNLTHKVNNVLWARPTATESAIVNCQVASTNGINTVNLYYSTDIVGRFISTTMYDDGTHNDGAANDGLYGATIPPAPGGNWVRYYVEGIANNTAKSAAYLPVGAEHDVFTYLVYPTVVSDAPIVINEVMASNTTYVADAAGEFDDWIELYNKSNTAVDISGYTLTDNDLIPTKFKIPANTIMQPNSYLIIWADENGSQGNLHASFKLSSTGETVSLLNTQKEIINTVTYGQQVTDSGFARIPNGTGNFVIKNPTYNANNQSSVGIDNVNMPTASMEIYPNPTTDKALIRMYNNDKASFVEIYSTTGQLIQQLPYASAVQISTAAWSKGTYIVRCGGMSKLLKVE